MASSTWDTRERPLLEAVITLEAAGDNLSIQRLAEQAGLTERDALLGVAALINARYLVGEEVTGMGEEVRQFIVEEPTERARRATGQWPPLDTYEDLVDLLDERIETTDDPEEKGKLRRLRDAVRDVGSGMMADVLARILEHQMGI